MTNWIHRDNEFKEILSRNNNPDNEEDSVIKSKAELIPHLKTTPYYRFLDRNTIKKLEQSRTFHTFNQALNEIYDYADDNKIWLGF